MPKEVELLEKLSNAFGPSGNETEVAEILRAELEEYADETHLDKLGNILFYHHGKDGYPKIMLATTVAYLQGPTRLEKVTYCLYERETLAIFEKEVKSLTSNMNIKPEDKT